MFQWKIWQGDNIMRQLAVGLLNKQQLFAPTHFLDLKYKKRSSLAEITAKSSTVANTRPWLHSHRDNNRIIMTISFGYIWLGTDGWVGIPYQLYGGVYEAATFWLWLICTWCFSGRKSNPSISCTNKLPTVGNSWLMLLDEHFCGSTSRQLIVKSI